MRSVQLLLYSVLLFKLCAGAHFERQLKGTGLKMRFEWDDPSSDIGEKDYYLYMEAVEASEGQKRIQRYTRAGSSTESNTCQSVRGVPSNLRDARQMGPNGLSSFYQKYTEAYGIPVVASSHVHDDALRRACYVLRFLLADNSGVRASFYKLSGRLGVVGEHETTTQIPEHSNLPKWWDTRARGLGAMENSPVSTTGEENILCYGPPKDRWSDEDIMVHEAAHGVHLLGAKYGIPGWDDRLARAFNHAKSTGLWANTYAMTDYREYFAEGTQSLFNVQARPYKGIHNDIDTPEKLKVYDRTLYDLLLEVYPCRNHILFRCNSTRQMEDHQRLKMDCNRQVHVTTSRPTTHRINSQGCQNDHTSCQLWADQGECDRNPTYMHVHCKQSCDLCSTAAPVSGCHNDHTKCQLWTDQGECDRNPNYMHVHCKQSCNLCSTAAPVATSDCHDDHKSCHDWATHDQCNANPGYMLKHCKKSCNSCSGRVAPVLTGCVDASINCRDWAAHGHCKLAASYMLVHCKKSCNSCTSGASSLTSPTCVDENTSCHDWATHNHCNINPGYMLKHCKKSCNSCTSGSGASQVFGK